MKQLIIVMLFFTLASSGCGWSNLNGYANSNSNSKKLKSKPVIKDSVRRRDNGSYENKRPRL